MDQAGGEAAAPGKAPLLGDEVDGHEDVQDQRPAPHPGQQPSQRNVQLPRIPQHHHVVIADLPILAQQAGVDPESPPEEGGARPPSAGRPHPVLNAPPQRLMALDDLDAIAPQALDHNPVA
ncbi:MAG: hypothetical protein DRP11_04010 [Candidatus Aenigmatarchaeota archaeon]|nr:MAG: hypothetical protein DRP11_04010 [Candidatus Aenigmarchaeota archaeon]